MAEKNSQNRRMFWRILRRMLGANRGRLFVVLLALGAGAAVTAALLNLQVDAKRRLTSEFRAFGANVVITPRGGEATDLSRETLPEDDLSFAFREYDGVTAGAAPFLYAIANVSSANGSPVKVVLVGTNAPGLSSSMAAGWKVNRIDQVSPIWDLSHCVVGSAVASRLGLASPYNINVSLGDAKFSCSVLATVSTGGPEDDQVFAHLFCVQKLTSTKGRISLMQAYVPGTAATVERYISDVQKQIPEADVRPVRQFTEGEAKIYSRISGVLTATVLVVLVLTSLCVMAAMTNVAMERKNDVGLMKAIGGATRRVVRLFLAEAALLGFAGGILGAAAGIALSIWLGKQIFGVAAQPRLIVYPVAVLLTVIVAILSAYPLRRLAAVRPASVFRGEA